MNGLLAVTLLALFPALGNIVGGFAAEWSHPSKKMLNRALHFATGVTLSIVAVQVMPTAMKNLSAWLIAFMFMIGGSTYVLVDIAIKKWHPSTASKGAWMIYIAIVADLIGDGLLIGSGSAVSAQLGLVLALGQVIADVPEGYALIADFRDKGMEKMKRVLLSFSFIIPAVGSAIVAFLVLRGVGIAGQTAGLAFVAGIFCLAAVEDMLEEAHDATEDSHWSSIYFLAGFALFIIVSGYFE